MKKVRGQRINHLIPTEVLSNSLKGRIAAKAIKLYEDSSAKYRKGDDEGYGHYSLAYFREQIGTITSAFQRKLSILDLGCGTGRYFHCLKNAEKITGVDVSESMLMLAKNPTRKHEIEAADIELICSDVHSVSLPAESFDFIYSIGLFGLHSPFNVDLCDKVFTWLKPGGKMYLYVMDAATPQESNWKREIAVKIFPILPGWLKTRIFLRMDDFSVTEQDLRLIMAESLFTDVEIIRSRDLDPEQRVWRRMWFSCMASRQEGP